MSEITITESNFEAEVMNSSIPVLVDFWAPWCGPCRMLAPVIEEIAKEYEGKLKVGKLNTDENPNISVKYMVASIPTLVIFKNKKEVERLVGVRAKEDLKKVINNVL